MTIWSNRWKKETAMWYLEPSINFLHMKVRMKKKIAIDIWVKRMRVEVNLLNCFVSGSCGSDVNCDGHEMWVLTANIKSEKVFELIFLQLNESFASYLIHEAKRSLVRPHDGNNEPRLICQTSRYPMDRQTIKKWVRYWSLVIGSAGIFKFLWHNRV